MTSTVRSIELPEEVVLSETMPSIEPTQLRFLLRKLSLRRGQTVVVIGCPEFNALRNLADCVGDIGKVLVLLTDEQLQARHGLSSQLQQLCTEYGQIIFGKLGPSAELQQADAMIIMSDRLTPPYEPLLDQAWRRLVSGGRIMLVLPEGEAHTDKLYQLIEVACRLGFVSRYRRCCNKHTAWVGVKYSNKG
ncbi:hypothetical protein [Ferrimonas lipolytica]|uniref:Uncharacterized protein n=1 Tax=Ferrimonas lipolytica TaxID=2724191 RepID=A0A6H1UF84_9GAMM|nr:hypothetical protein [Ferrimonas lipolytica]QIZ76993.1 hypothetical protein HER31_08935 [Ferrimonas lipolytica]